MGSAVHAAAVIFTSTIAGDAEGRNGGGVDYPWVTVTIWVLID